MIKVNQLFQKIYPKNASIEVRLFTIIIFLTTVMAAYPVANNLILGSKLTTMLLDLLTFTFYLIISVILVYKGYSETLVIISLLFLNVSNIFFWLIQGGYYSSMTFSFLTTAIFNIILIPKRFKKPALIITLTEIIALTIIQIIFPSIISEVADSTLAALPFDFLIAVILIAFFVFVLRDSYDGERSLLVTKNSRLHQSNHVIESQNEELKQQGEELKAQNEILEQTIIELKATQSQLVQSEKMSSIGILTAGVAHEINNPINYIKNGMVGLNRAINGVFNISETYAQLTEENFKEKLLEIEQLKKDIDYTLLKKLVKSVSEDIQHGVERTSEIVSQLRTYSRLDTSEPTLHNIHDGINSTLVLLYNQYKGRIEIHKEYNEIPMIECFFGKLNQVFMNLLSNAIQAINKEGNIWIRTAKEGNEIKIEIEDSGEGISPDALDRIYDPFFTTKEVGKGTGLGLSISKSIVEEHHGAIEVSSEIGKGTKFTIYLPIQQYTTNT